MIVRSADGDDLPTLARLEAACFASDPWGGVDLATYWGSGALAAFLLEDGDRACAYAIFQLLPGEVELLRVGVPPTFRGRGLAGRLLATALERLAAAGRPCCHLEVRAGNEPARRLYERLGFAIAGRRRAYYGDGEDALRYVRESASASG